MAKEKFNPLPVNVVHDLVDTYATRIEPYLEDISEWRSNGMTIVAISKKLCLKYHEFGKAIKEHIELQKVVADANYVMALSLEDTLLKEAKGYKYTTQQESTIYDSDGNITGKKVVKNRLYKAPNTELLLKILTVSNPSKWDEKAKPPEAIEVGMSAELEDYAG